MTIIIAGFFFSFCKVKQLCKKSVVKQLLYTPKLTDDVSAVNPDKSLISTMSMLVVSWGPW